MRGIVFAVVLVGCAVAAGTARAQDTVVQPEAVNSRLNAELWGEVGFWTSHPPAVDQTVMTMDFGGGYRVTRQFLLRAEWPLYLANASFDVGGLAVHDTAFDTGNPFVSAYYVYESREVRLLAGGGLTVPIAPSRNPIDTLGGGWAAGVHGLVDEWLWVPDIFALVARVEVENATPIGGFLLLRADLAMAPLIPVGNAAGRNVQFDVQPGATVGFQVTPQFSFGFRFWLAWVATANGDNTQASLTPYFRGDFGRGFFDASFTMNLDTPLGFSFEQGKTWGMRFSGGVRF